MVRLAKSRRTETAQEGKPVRWWQGFLRIHAIVLGVLGFAAGRFQRDILRLDALLSDEFIIATS